MASLPYPRHPLNNPPTDGTDAHRCLGCVVLSHGTRRIHRSLLLWEDAVAAWLVQFLLGWCSSCLVGAVETTAPPGRQRGYGRDAIPSYNCTDREGVLKYLCASVTSVGEYLSKNFCEFGEFCGKIVWWQRGYGRMPYPPISAPPEEISLSTCLLVNLSTNKKKNYVE